ncbi:MAG: NfeD family protein, partial [Anaerolineae bacterium]
MKARSERARAARRLKLIIYVLMMALSLVSSWSAEAQAPAGRVDVLTVTGAITPIIQTYITRGIEQAEMDGAAALVIQLDTPGGSVDVTKAITQRMLAARVPVVVFV